MYLLSNMFLYHLQVTGNVHVQAFRLDLLEGPPRRFDERCLVQETVSERVLQQLRRSDGRCWMASSMVTIALLCPSGSQYGADGIRANLQRMSVAIPLLTIGR